MSRCVDFNDMQACIKQGIERHMTLKQFLGFMDEWNAVNMDPLKFLGPEHIPGTTEWEKTHKVYAKILDKFCNKDKGAS